MAKRVRFEHSSAGYQDVMKSAGMRADLQRRAETVRQAADAQYSRWDDEAGDPIEVVADTDVGSTRAGAVVATVHPAALRIEAKHRILGHAIDAAG